MLIHQSDKVASMPVTIEGAKDVDIRVLIGPSEQAPIFYMRQFNVAPGGHTPRHSHDWEHEAYILAGTASVLSADGERNVSAGDCLFVPGGEIHQFKNAGSSELKFLCIVPVRAMS